MGAHHSVRFREDQRQKLLDLLDQGETRLFVFNFSVVFSQGSKESIMHIL